MKLVKFALLKQRTNAVFKLRVALGNLITHWSDGPQVPVREENPDSGPATASTTDKVISF